MFHFGSMTSLNNCTYFNMETIYLDKKWLELSKTMSDTEKANYFFAILTFCIEGYIPTVPSSIQVQTEIVCQCIDEVQKKKERICNRNRINGMKGGAPKKNQNAFKHYQNNPKTTQKQPKTTQSTPYNNILNIRKNIKKDADALPPLPYDPETDYGRFRKYIEDNMPFVSKLYPIKQEQYERLISMYTNKAIIKTLREMDNWSDLVKKNRYQYNTLLKWLQKDKNR